MNKNKVKEAIQKGTVVTWQGQTYVIAGIYTFIKNSEWYSKLLLFDSRLGKMEIAEVQDVNGGEFI